MFKRKAPDFEVVPILRNEDLGVERYKEWGLGVYSSSSFPSRKRITPGVYTSSLASVWNHIALSNFFLGNRLGEILWYDTLHYMTFLIFYILSQLENPGSTIPVARISNFEFFFPWETRSTYPVWTLWPVSGTRQGIFVYPLPHGCFQRTLLVFVLTGSQAMFPSFMDRRQNSHTHSHTQKAN